MSLANLVLIVIVSSKLANDLFAALGPFVGFENGVGAPSGGPSKIILVVSC